MIRTFLFICLLGYMQVTALFATGISDIGNITNIKVYNGKLYAAGSKGIAELSSPTEAKWTIVLPEIGVRMIEVNNEAIAYTGYDFAGIDRSKNIILSNLGDKLTISKTLAGMIDLSGKGLWEVTLDSKERISPPSIGKDIMALNAASQLIVLSRKDGKVMQMASNCTAVGPTSGMISQSMPNQPLIYNDAIYSTGFCKLMKTDLSGKEVASSKFFALMKPFEGLTTPPLLFNDQIIFGNCASGADVPSKVFSTNAEMKDDLWTDFHDKQSAVGSLATNGEVVVALSNYLMRGYNKKGKDIWENDEIGLPGFRGVRYVGASFGTRSSHGNLLCVDNKYVYTTGYIKPKKKNTTANSNVTIIDVATGKLVKVIEIPNMVDAIDMQVMGTDILLVVPDGILKLSSL